mmetsp:Transcript_41770/g.119482  ORF Transcript_41770/g.119482 Transcript_41770/m.119482 type:complete len:278 (-) Transcript_41770:44-877(-)
MDDGFVDVGEEPLLADEVLELGLAHRLVHPVADHGETHLNAAAPEVGDDVVDDVAGGGVHRDHRRHFEHQVLRRVHVLNVCDISQQHVLDVLGVRKVERGANPADEDVGDEAAAALLLHVAVDRGARDAPQDGELGAHGLIDHDDQRQGHRDEDAFQHAEEQGAQKGDHPEQEIVPLHTPEVHRLAQGNQGDDGVQHNGRQNELRQPEKQRREEHQSGEHDDHRHEARELRHCARGVVDGGAGEAAGHRVAREEGTDDVGEAQGQHLLAGVNIIAVL